MPCRRTLFGPAWWAAVSCALACGSSRSGRAPDPPVDAGGSRPAESSDAASPMDAGTDAAIGFPDAALQVEASAPDAAASPMPLRHVIVIVKENHTFDNYFGSFPGAEGTLAPEGENVCVTPTGTGPCVRAPDAPTHDLCHGHSCALVDWNNGRMDGWNAPGGSDTGDGLVYAQYTERDIPNYWQYARHFVLGDHFLANVLPGPPPMILAAHPYWGCDQWAGDTLPILQNGVTEARVFPCFDIPAIPD